MRAQLDDGSRDLGNGSLSVVPDMAAWHQGNASVGFACWFGRPLINSALLAVYTMCARGVVRCRHRQNQAVRTVEEVFVAGSQKVVVIGRGMGGALRTQHTSPATAR